MIKNIRKTVVACVVVFSGFSISAHAAVWNNNLGDNVMTNDANWSAALTSSSFLDIALSDADRVVLSDGMSLAVGDVRIGVNTQPGLAGELEIVGGYLRSNRNGGDTRIGYSGRTGIVNQSGGKWEVAQTLVVGIGGTGIYNLSGGELDQQRDEFRIAGANSIMTISGGILKTRSDATIQSGSTFKVEGTGASFIGIGGSASGNGTWIQNAGGVLSIRIDETLVGVTAIDVQGATGDVTFEDGALLDVDFTGAFTNGGTFTVMDWEGSVTDHGLQFADGVDTNIWSFNVDAAGKKLTVTAQGDSTADPVSGTMLDTLAFGDPASEAMHALISTNTQVITGGLGEAARQCLPLDPVDYYGGSMTVTMKVDPERRNYFTLKLWSNDDTTSAMGRLYLYIVEDGTDYQVGFRHEGDYMPLSVPAAHPGLPDRFFYSTTMLPLEMTRGKTAMTFRIVSMGRLYALGKGGEKDGGNYQFLMDTNSRGIYRAYTHVDPYLDVSGETQGTAPVATVRPSPTEATLRAGGSFYNSVKNRINSRLNTSISTDSSSFLSTFSKGDIRFLARSYSVSGLTGETPLPGYQNEAVVNKVVALLDAFAKSYYEDNSRAQDWGGAYGVLGEAVFYLQDFQNAQLLTPAILDTVVDYGIGGSKARREAWGDMLYASREYGRLKNRRTITNQALAADSSIYAANRGLQCIGDPRAFSESVALRYIKETCGLLPWMGNDLPDSNGNGQPDDGSEMPYGDNYYQVTADGQTCEWGYVGAGYGDLAYRAAEWYRMSGDEDLLQQMVKMAKARAPFRRPAIEVDGSNYYRTMETVGLLAWRGAHESDGEFGGYITYGSSADTGFGPKGLITAARSGDPDLIGYAKQQLEDNQYFAYLPGYSSGISALEVFEDYEAVRDAVDSGTRLPMTDGQPDFAWADEGNRIIALKHGDDRLWVEPYWQAKSGSGINGVARFQYDAPNYTQYGVLETVPQFTFDGFYTRTINHIDKQSTFQWLPPEPRPLQAYGNEILPFGLIPEDASIDQPFRGKADFYAFRFGRYLMGINASEEKTYTLKTPPGFSSATNLVTGLVESGTIIVAPTSSVALVLADVVDAAPVPGTPLVLFAKHTGDGVGLEWSAASGADSYTLKRSSIKGGPYSVVASNIIATGYSDTEGEPSDYYVVAAVNANGESYNSMESVMTTALPAPWANTDIGDPDGEGAVAYDDGTYTISGAGSDIGNGSDELHFAYLSLSGDGSLTARLSNIQNAGSAGKIGLMMRESTDAGSRLAAYLVDISGTDNMRMPIRSSTGESMNWTDATGSDLSGYPVWMRLVRSGSTFTGYVSTDGETWTEDVSRSVSLNNTLLVGFAVCSRADPALSTAVVDNVSLSGWSLSGQETWRFEYFGTYLNSVSGNDDADPDGDLLNNLLEYGTGSDPNEFTDGPVSTLGLAEDRLTLTFDRISDPALTYWVEGASNLASNDWSTIWSSTGTSNTAGEVTVEDTELISDYSTRFLRLKLTN
ncbi:hypothetical protein P4C99_20800 [Pontiellaceae bacterium B1224]|nr:hypothetical protein [Pontiellaceae bacterium B1224]